jgi:TATA-box binding protein (TBP) (component of TFIID and TFIIIB)
MENPTLSTMVVLYTTNLKFDTTKLAEILPITETIIKVEKKGLVKKGESSRDKIKHRSKKEKKTTNNTGFGHNSITIVMMNDGNGELVKKEITVKIFQNGVFHLTGVLDERYDKDSMKKLLQILHTTCQESYREPVETIETFNRRVVLMNYTTKLLSNETIPRETLHNSIRTSKLENVMSFYDPDVYPGVKIHVGTDKWTAKVFRTGKIILTGIICEEDCKEFMRQLLVLFEQVLPRKQTLAYTSNTVALR